MRPAYNTDIAIFSQYQKDGLTKNTAKHLAIYYTQLLDADVCYTIDGSKPVPGKCTVGRNVTIYKNTVVKAIAYYPDQSETSASEVMFFCMMYACMCACMHLFGTF
jgi:hypothetical protein